MAKQPYNNWELNTDQNNIVWLSFNRHGSSTNTFNPQSLNELGTILDTLPEAKGLVITSAKSSGYIAGADVDQFKSLENTDEALAFIHLGQSVFQKLEDLAIPTVAMIEGFCLGGGLEMALACRYRIAEEGPSTRLGLPEVMLGIHPGWGGTVRLPRLIGALKAMDLILSGRAVSASAARKMGFVDEVVPKRQLKHAAIFYVMNQPAAHTSTTFEKLTNHHWMRYGLAKILRRQVSKKISQDHYPAPYAAIDNWQHHGVNSKSAFRIEADSIGNLIVNNETAKNLVRLFSLRERLKHFGNVEDISFKHVHVIGAGVMGGDIAAWCALKGLTVTLQDREAKYISPAIKRAHGLFKKVLKRPHLVRAAHDRLMPDVKGDGIYHADIIIEAIIENLDAKQVLFKQVESKARPDAVLATNTSTIPLEEINTVLSQPERLVGIHFFNPVAKMQLVEVVNSKLTSKEISEKAYAFVKCIDRLPLPVKSSPGFLVNRILMPYLMECFKLVEEGIPIAAIDAAAEDFGMAMGPVELADTVGLDVCLGAAIELSKHFGGTIPTLLETMVEQGHLGRKVGKGFYLYKKGKPQKSKVEPSFSRKNEIATRLILRQVNEATACLREGIVDDADLLDAGMVFGTGFAPFRGGPLHYADQLGSNELGKLFAQLEEQFGERFKFDQKLRLKESQ